MAEDHSDVEVVRTLLGKIRDRKLGIKAFVGGGCGNLRKKCRMWAQILRERGCSVLILLHDLDRASLPVLRAALTAALEPCVIKDRIIVIPVQELEAWFLADPSALRKAFNLQKVPTCPSNPEGINDPKEFLRDLIWRKSGKTKRYINTIHNQRIAEHVSVAAVRKCKAFRLLEEFWQAVP